MNVRYAAVALAIQLIPGHFTSAQDYLEPEAGILNTPRGRSRGQSGRPTRTPCAVSSSRLGRD